MFLGELLENDRYACDISNKQELQELLCKCVELGASDIIFQAGNPVGAFVRGRMFKVTEAVFDDAQVLQTAMHLSGIDSIASKINSGDAFDKGITVTDRDNRDDEGDYIKHRFRVNISPCEHNNVSSAQIVCRAIPALPPTVEDILLEKQIVDESAPSMGGVILAGETGSGKTTTFAALTRRVLEGRTNIVGPVLTFEAPIEFLFDGIDSKVCTIAQTEIGKQTPSFAEGVRGALRRSPRLCLVGELRDYETIESAIELMNTGCPVYTTTHANDVSLVFQRLATKYPPSQQLSAYQSLVMATHMIVSQVLVRTPDGKGRVCLREWLVLSADLKEELSKCNFHDAALICRREMKDGIWGRSMEKTVLKYYKDKKIGKEEARWALLRYGYRNTVL